MTNLDSSLLLQWAVVTLFIALGLGSLWVWVLIGRRLSRNRQPLPLHDRPLFPLDAPDAFLVLVLWIAIPFMLMATLGAREEPPPAETAALGAAGAAVESQAISLRAVQLNVLANAVLLAVALPILKFTPLRFGERRRLADYGITLENWKREAAYGGLGFLAALVPVYLMLVATTPFRTQETQHEFLKVVQRTGDLETVAWMVLAAVVFAPLAEELVFRVVLQGTLETRTGPEGAVVGSSLLFAAVHGWPDALPLIPLALTLGYVYQRRRSYVAVVVLHALFNLWNLLLALSVA